MTLGPLNETTFVPSMISFPLYNYLSNQTTTPMSRISTNAFAGPSRHVTRHWPLSRTDHRHAGASPSRRAIAEKAVKRKPLPLTATRYQHRLPDMQQLSARLYGMRGTASPRPSARRALCLHGKNRHPRQVSHAQLVNDAGPKSLSHDGWARMLPIRVPRMKTLGRRCLQTTTLGSLRKKVCMVRCMEGVLLQTSRMAWTQRTMDLPGSSLLLWERRRNLMGLVPL